jgi:hypothetical protein
MIRRGFQKKEEKNLASIRAALETAPGAASTNDPPREELKGGVS